MGEGENFRLASTFRAAGVSSWSEFLAPSTLCCLLGDTSNSHVALGKFFRSDSFCKRETRETARASWKG